MEEEEEEEKKRTNRIEMFKLFISYLDQDISCYIID